MRALLLLLTLAACGGTSPQPTTPPPAPPPPSEPLTPVVPVEDPKAACANHPDEYGPYMLTDAQAAKRYGLGVAKFTDAPTTKDKPIEVCGIPQQQAWLMSTQCADGSKAFTGRGQVMTNRKGNVGEGGRCGSIIDLYIATCPEAKYEVHIDMYMCGPNDQF
jgi:hypothetical protein